MTNTCKGDNHDRTGKRKIIKKVNATIDMEDTPLTEEDKQRIKDILDGKITAEEAIQNIIAKYKQ